MSPESTINIVDSPKKKMPLMDTWGSGFRVIFLSFIVFTFLSSFMFTFSGRHSGRSHARQKACISNMRTIEGAIEMYLMDHDVKECKWIPKQENETLTLDTSKTSPLVKDKYLKKFPTCKAGGKYVLHGPADSLHVECTIHGTVEKSRLDIKEQNKFWPKSMQSFSRDIIFSLLIAGIMTAFIMSRLNDFSNGSIGKFYESAIRLVTFAVFFHYLYLSFILSMMHSNSQPDEKILFYGILFLLLRGFSVFFTQLAITRIKWTKEVLTRFLKIGLPFDLFIFISTVYIITAGKRVSELAFVSLFGLTFIMYILVMPWLYVNLKKILWQKKSDISKKIFYRKPFSKIQKIWIFILLVIIYSVCRSVLSDQIRRGSYQLSSKIRRANVCKETMQSISDASEKFITSYLNKGYSIQYILDRLTVDVDSKSLLVKSKFCKVPPTYGICKYKIVSSWDGKKIDSSSYKNMFTVLCNEHGTRDDIESFSKKIENQKNKKSSKALVKSMGKTIFLSFFFALLLAMRMRPGQYENDRPVFKDFLNSDYNGHNIYRSAILTQMLLILFITILDIFYINIPSFSTLFSSNASLLFLVLIFIRILWYVAVIKSIKLIKNSGFNMVIIALVVDLIYCAASIASKNNYFLFDATMLYVGCQFLFMTMFHSYMSAGSISRQKELILSLAE